MTILFFTRLFYPHIGGVERHVYEVSRELVARGHKVTIVTEKFDEDSAEQQEFEGMEVYRIPVGKNEWIKKFVIWRWLFVHRKLMKQANVIHCNDVFFWYLPFRFFYLTKKIFITFHGYEGNDIPNKRSVLMHKIAEKFSLGNICIGEFLRKWYNTKPNFISYGGVNPLGERIGYKKIEPRQKISFVFVGRLERETGIMVYLRAMQVVQARGFAVNLIILGDGSKRNEAERFCQKNKLSAKFTGFVTDMDRYIFAAHFVFTSRYLGIIEALSRKKFVFAVYNNEIKKDYLYMTPFVDFFSITKDDNALSEEIVFHIQNQHVAFEKTKKGFLWAEKQTWERLTDTYLQLWTKKERGSSGRFRAGGDTFY